MSNDDSLVDSLADRIRLRIQAGSFADGDLFMTESQLATEYAVSRTVAREAVSRLTALGLVEGRQRKGLVIRRPDPLRLFSQSLPSASLDDLRELTQLRYVIEVGGIELSVRNADERQIEQLQQIVDAFALALHSGDTVSQVIALDLEFHSLLLQMTGSSLVAGMQQVLVRFFAAVPYLTLDEAGIENVIWQHRELCEAVRERDVERARSMIRAHLRRRLPNSAVEKS